eukprot:TRINITY_DN2981_c0_g1_i3.p1 TRINITY_DN2981_c0_g1~~TRINITY_DN2981_c0_g1_i3.p1  ORF type:complete len:190 (+),score=7.35 TRINITY_DN2981_c0_g1_i3:153-722(+)
MGCGASDANGDGDVPQTLTTSPSGGTYALPPIIKSNELRKSQDRRPSTATEKYGPHLLAACFFVFRQPAIYHFLCSFNRGASMITIKVELGTVTAMGTFQGKQVGHVYISETATVEELHRQIRLEVVKTKRATQMLDLNPKKTIKQNKLKNGAAVCIIFDDEDPNNDTYDEYAGYDPGNTAMVELPSIG